MKKNILFVCATIMLVLCFSVTGAMAGKKDKCIELCTTWDGDNETDCSLVWLYADGGFEIIDGEMSYNEGEWAEHGGSFAMQCQYDCALLFAGSKKRGFFECTGSQFAEGSIPAAPVPPEGFNTYEIKKVSKKRCEEMMDDN